MMRLSNVLLIAALATATGACGLENPAPREVAPQKNRIQVERMLYRHTVAFTGDAEQPSAGERRALRAFLKETGADRDATVVVTANPGTMADRRRREVIRMLRGMGFRPRPEDPLLDPKPASGDDVLVRVARYHAIPPDCPDFSRSRIGDYYNMTTSNFGCASATNLSLMVSNPRDLLRGRELPPADAERQARRVRHYRIGKKPDFIRYDKDGAVVFEEPKPDKQQNQE